MNTTTPFARVCAGALLAAVMVVALPVLHVGAAAASEADETPLAEADLAVGCDLSDSSTDAAPDPDAVLDRDDTPSGATDASDATKTSPTAPVVESDPEAPAPEPHRASCPSPAADETRSDRELDATVTEEAQQPARAPVAGTAPVGGSPVTAAATPTLVAPTRPVPRAVIGDIVWTDRNKDGRSSPGEQGIAGAHVVITNRATGDRRRMATAADGSYRAAVEPGNYTVAIEMDSADDELTTAEEYEIFLESGEEELDADFGFVEELGADADLPLTGSEPGVLLGVGLVTLASGILLVGVHNIGRTRRERAADVT